MNIDQLKSEFESDFPLPYGVHWDGDFLHGTHEIMGSHRNATEFSAMFRGYKRRAERESLAVLKVGFHGVSDGRSIADVAGRAIPVFVECSETQPGAAQPFIKVTV